MFDEVLEAVGGTAGRVVGLGLALGAGVLIGRGMRPVAKGAIRGVLAASERVREYAAEAGESLEDLYHEAKSERDQVNSQHAPEVAHQ
jgi:Protein of unknown function (DUF5132)